MTAKEVIGYLECFKDWNKDDLWLSNDDIENFVEYCTKAIKEVQQYRKIGTPEELTRAQKYIDLAKQNGTIGKMIEECAAYEEIGTVEECREAVEKQKPKKPNMTGMDEQDYYTCPNCGEDIGSIDDYLPRDRYCHNCGQTIRWENENLEGMKDE